MSHIRRSFAVLMILCIGLSACATATPISTTTPGPTETLTAITKPPTETPSPTPEPTATATPEIIPSKPTEITFNLTNGETLSMPGFIPNTPEGRELTEEEKIKLLENAFVYMVDDGIDWTIASEVQWESLSQNIRSDVLKLNPIMGIVHIGGDTVPYNMEGERDVFALGFSTAPYNGVEGTLLKYYTDEGGYSAIYVQMDVDEVISLLSQNIVNIPPKP